MSGDLQLWRRWQRLGGPGALVVLALTVAACSGGAPGPSVASLGAPHDGSSPTGGGAGGTGPGGAAASSTGGVSSSGGNQVHLVMAGGKNSLEFSQCMQTHGEPNFPDPGANGAISVSSGNGVDPGSPAYQKALTDCRKYLPSGTKAPTGAALQKMQDEMLAYSACMRANGVPAYPDPTFLNGGATVRIGGSGSNGIDPSTPQFQHAQSVCEKGLAGTAGGKGGPIGGGPAGPKG